FESSSELVFQDLVSELNRQHGTEYPLHYWRIVVGAWFQQFAQVVHMRLKIAEYVFKTYGELKVAKLDLTWQELLPVTHDEASLLFATDIWNHYIYVEAINFVAKSATENILVSSTERNKELLEYRQNVNFGLPSPQTKSKLESLLAKLSPNPKVVLAGVVQSKLALVVMHLRLRSLPRLWRFSSKLTAHPIDEVARQQFKISQSSTDRFEKFLRELLATNLPTIYLEGFKELQNKVMASQIKQHPKLIFTNTLLHRNEQFKVWSAEHCVFGATKLVSGQHGGGYGQKQCTPWTESYEISILDRFLTWGWSDIDRITIPVGVQSHQTYSTPDKYGGLLVVLGPVTRNSDDYGMICVQTNSSYFDYLKELINVLPEHISKQTYVRPKNANSIGKPARVSAQQVSDLLGNLIKIDLGIFGLNETQSQNRLSVVTYNETTIPTNLLAGYPMVAMWDPKYVRLTSTAATIYESLFRAKILHYTPNSAALHVANIWADVDAWWQSPETIKARLKYCEYFARQTKFPALAVAKAMIDYR
ncbi:MAG: LIC12162 family protein, partial [Actinobacteria bacterium]|nr:LIC12162 family protein [Actinomycetota bacterium]